MPTYQYRCTDCGEPLEVVQSFTDDPLTVCPSCSGTLRKVFSAVGVVFKGSGFYRTDSRAETSKKSETPTEPTKSDPSETKVDKTSDKPSDKPGDKPADKPAATKPAGKTDSSTASTSAA